MRVVAIIPARYKSSRFPGKPLIPIAGIPMIIRVASLAAKAVGRENVYIATDDRRICDCAREHGHNHLMTPETCMTGTDRLWHAVQQIQADIYVNIQGDEPLLDPADIRMVIEHKKKNPYHVINAMCPLAHDEDPADIDIPKVVADRDKKLIYMSRLPIPGIKSDTSGTPRYMKQVCIYAFSYRELEAFGSCKSKSEYEKYEDIEILRFFDLGIPVMMVEMRGASRAVDRPEDVMAVEGLLGPSGK